MGWPYIVSMVVKFLASPPLGSSFASVVVVVAVEDIFRELEIFHLASPGENFVTAARDASFGVLLNVTSMKTFSSSY